MAVPKKENKIKRWEKIIKSYEVSNPELAKRWKGKLEALKGKKEIY